ncbi:MAG TPA: hypothetical protein VL981_11010 [Candidatus Methylacidiphilales bacterium]|nr:hypothetical protein [Candidatus Methylacidiphilales bacterium]
MRPSQNWKAFAGELILYAMLLWGYFVFVLHYLADWLKELFDHDRWLFATVALLLMIGQAAGLEIVSSFLFQLIRRRQK